ncbi:MAG TPA: hypothetical protein VFQ61_27395 [Polyangiaceae bacterium]|nr:hypothetical protein [Polyangiaceae bacterium]
MNTAISDLARRWCGARRAALRAFVPDASAEASETELLPAALDIDAEGVLRRVFDNSERLGGSFRQYYTADLTVLDLTRILPALQVPCFAFAWTDQSDPPHYRGQRKGCASRALHGRTCDYFREAGQGLVLGLTSSVHHARHESLNCGDAECVDVLFVHAQSPARFGPIPAPIRLRLATLEQTVKMFDSSARLRWLGISERILYYTLEHAGCDNVDLNAVVARSIKRRCPQLGACNASPKSVLSSAPPQACAR